MQAETRAEAYKEISRIRLEREKTKKSAIEAVCSIVQQENMKRQEESSEIGARLVEEVMSVETEVKH